MVNQPALRLIDSDGVIHEGQCPHCEEREAAVVQLEKDLRVAKAKVTRLERTAEEKARNHKLWDEAEALHGWWAIACDHPGATFDAEAFQQVLPRLKNIGPVGVLHAIAGAACDPHTRPRANGTTERYDSWEIVNRSEEKARNFAERAPFDARDPHCWKKWLIKRIESRLK